MEQSLDLEKLASAIGSATRIGMLSLLMEGRALTAKELAVSTGIEPGTATSHLNQLINNGLIKFVTQGRFKYFRIASPEVAHLVESMMVVAPPLKVSRALPSDEMCKARYCYDHLAGELGTSIYNAFIGLDLISENNNNIAITNKCLEWMDNNHINYDSEVFERRKPITDCLDWSERTSHIGGALGAVIANHFTESGWILRVKGQRVVKITSKGKQALKELLDIEIS